MSSLRLTRPFIFLLEIFELGPPPGIFGIAKEHSMEIVEALIENWQ
jgi:hypothetical protein